jgi:lysine 6-dehydrogenase
MEQKRVAILGGGMVGAAICADLAADGAISVAVMDKNEDSLAKVRARHAVETRLVDLTAPDAIRECVGGFDLVMGALPGGLGFGALGAVIDAGKTYLDVSFMPEDATELSPKAKALGVTAVFDCGLAPGLSHMMAGYAAHALDPCERIRILSGGLPVERRWPFEYKAGFSPADVIEEYTRPARSVERGEIVAREALSDPELVDVPGIGTLEAVRTDGLRSLLRALRVPEMQDKTLRYPGHAALMRALRETGLFSKEPLDVPGGRVRPLDVTAALLFPRWTFAPGEADFTVMRVIATGKRAGVATTMTWDLLDRCDPATGLLSLSRTTAFPATITARLLLDGRLLLGPGVHPPVVLGREPGFLKTMLAELGRRGVTCSARVEEAGAA